MEQNERKYEPMKIFLSVLVFGGLWGIIEATLGTVIHLPFVKAAGIFMTSTTIMVPIAFFVMSACYKRTGTFRSVLYMGLLAASAKALVCAIFKLDPTPVFYILLESVCMAGALAAIRPSKIISFQGLGTMIFASTSYLVLSVFIRFKFVLSPADQVMAYFEKYVFMLNCIAILYTFAFGALLFGFTKLAEKLSWNFDGVKKIIYSPITASVMASVMVVVMFLVR